jgi:hypothetical protein
MAIWEPKFGPGASPFALLQPGAPILIKALGYEHVVSLEEVSWHADGPIRARIRFRGDGGLYGDAELSYAALAKLKEPLVIDDELLNDKQSLITLQKDYSPVTGYYDGGYLFNYKADGGPSLTQYGTVESTDPPPTGHPPADLSQIAADLEKLPEPKPKPIPHHDFKGYDLALKDVALNTSLSKMAEKISFKAFLETQYPKITDLGPGVSGDTSKLVSPEEVDNVKKVVSYAMQEATKSLMHDALAKPLHLVAGDTLQCKYQLDIPGTGKVNLTLILEASKTL